ncbi:MAG: Ig-like domain-containing protein, partial [Candidatus Zixiibacteriota bacterium]
MGRKCFDIYGGARVARRLGLFRMQRLIGLSILLLLLHTSVAFAQGSIFGVVRNANLTTPANGEISFYGFTDNTDDEIRLESSIGAGYDAGNWFDDFQNFLSKTPGNPYMYRFFNTTNGEGAVLAKPIPNNSFQQEDITLGTVVWPASPAGMAGRVVSTTSVVLTWTRVAGQSYHVYRRPATSGGSFFRIDNPAGLLTNPGVADSFFVDNTVSGGGSFHYLLIAQDASGNLGPHSTILTVNTAAPVAPFIASIAPNTGSAFGGTSVVIAGSGFDINGATATIGGAAMTSVTVVSPFQINGVTPAGTAGAANVVVTNTASALSGTLTGGYTYLGNIAPVLATIGPRSVNEGANLNFGVSATDADGTTPILTTTTPLPTNATFLDNGNGTGTFNFNPTFAQAGTYNVTFYASDGIAIDSEQVVITVNNVNQAPVLAAIGPRSVNEGANLNFGVSATDPDGTTPILTTTTPLPANATFTDNGNGTGTFNFNPSFSQAGTFNVMFYASDGTIIDSEQVVITVTNVNQAPVLATIGPRSVVEGATLNFVVSAADADGTTPSFTTTTPL